MANLDKETRWKGVITSSAADALSIAYSANKLRTPSIIVLPEYTTKAKVKELTRLGSTVKLYGSSAEAAKEECLRLQSLHDLTLIAEPGDEYSIAGYGTIGPEIISQRVPSQIKAVFCPIGCGSLIAGLGIYLKRITPNIKVIGVELHDSADISRLVRCKGYSTLEEHLLSRNVCPNLARMCSEVIDDVVQVSTNEVLIATKELYEDTRQLLDVEGVISVAGMKSWIISNGLVGSEKDFIAITSESQLDLFEIPNIIKQASLAEMATVCHRGAELDFEVLNTLNEPDITDYFTFYGVQQGVPYAIRKVISIAKIKVHIIVEPVDPSNASSKFRFKLTSSVMGLGIIGAAPLRAVGFQTDNTDVRVMDGIEQEKDEPMIGKTKSRIWMCTIEELNKEPNEIGEVTEFLKQGWEGYDEKHTNVVRISVKSAGVSNAEPWQNEQVWGLQKGRWTARVAFRKGSVSETARILYDYVS
ncbi:hypothetical protein IL306_015332 [Fusarium sp. DS 682]|nr:hypothetical protein IL306_015332 [Fusarium sp. DS 682]